MSKVWVAIAQHIQTKATKLVAYSFLMLFTELALIRWLGANVLYLSYFSNFVLLASFLGIGVGFLRARSSLNLSGFAPIAIAILVVFIKAFPITVQNSNDQILFVGVAPSGISAWVVLPIIFLAVAFVMMFIAEGVGRLFANFEPLIAYRYDILGSLLGIISFSLLSFLEAPPFIWGIIVAVFLIALLPKPPKLIVSAFLLAMIVVLGSESLKPGLSWSPYYAVQQDTVTAHGEYQHYQETVQTIRISVNSIPHQQMIPTAFANQNDPIHLHFAVYDHLDPNVASNLNNVLIVGAGTGNDVANALARGAKHVDAVEIDPRLQQIGAQLHPDHPYQDPRVTVHIGDGRAFLEHSNSKYDLILFALPDSLTLVSGQSSLRLESYLFTREAMVTARNHLTSRGVFSMYNFYFAYWLIDRYAETLTEAYSGPPCLDISKTNPIAVLTESVKSSSMHCTALPKTITPDRTIVVWKAPANPPAPATDDYPFAYLLNRGIPALYMISLSLILIVSLVFIRSVAGPFRHMQPYVDLFFMGIAFLLLETKSIVQFSLLFGTTWFVNALVFGGILLAVLLAIEIAQRITVRRNLPLYLVLFALLTLAWFVPVSALLSLDYLPRLLVATLITFSPILLANIIFAERFKNVGASTIAFGANLLGAMMGGILEYSALIIGYRALLIMVAIAYALAFLTRRIGQQVIASL